MTNSENTAITNGLLGPIAIPKEYSFYFYLLSVFITYIGNSITFIVCGKYSLDLFGLVSIFGGLLLLEQFKSLILSTLSGYLVNMYSSKAISVYCDLGCFLVMLFCSTLAYFGHLKVSIIASMFLLNLVKPFYNTSIFTLVRQISSKNQLFKLNSRTAVAQQFGCFVGLAFSAYLISRISVSSLLLIDAITFLVSALCLASCKEVTSTTKERAKVLSEKKNFSLMKLKLNIDVFANRIKSNYKLLYLAVMIGVQVNLIIAYNTCLFKLVSTRFSNHPDYLSYLEIAYSIAIVMISVGIEKFNVLKFSLSSIKILFLIQSLVFFLLSFNMPFTFIVFIVAIYGSLNSLIFPVLFTEFYKVIPADFLASSGGLKGTLQALTAIPILIITGLITDCFNLNSSYLFISFIGLILILLTLKVEKSYV